LFKSTFDFDIEQIDDVHRIKVDVPWSLQYISIYFFEHKGKRLLFDSGFNMANSGELFFSALKKLNLSILDIDYCFISHNHTDHVGLAPLFKRENPNIKILMSEITAKTLEWETKEGNYIKIEAEAQKIADQMITYGFNKKQSRKVVQFLSFWPKQRQYQEPDIVLHDGDVILDDLEVIWTPGHSFGHICLFHREKRYLFCGDHILSRITPHIGNYVIPKFLTEQYPEYGFENILKHYLISLDKIDELNPKIIFPAHQDIIYDPHKRISEIEEHHKNRLAEISGVIKNKPLTPLKISRIHFGEDLDETNSYLALSETLAHLKLLEQQNKVKTMKKNGKILYFS
jgi:glyoxylase-like metal-dependent hydrolase (beta-lactamase superfamily II)